MTSKNHEINCFVGFNLHLRTNQMHHFLKNDAFDFTMTVKRALSEILSSESIIKVSGSRYTKHVWNRAKE